MRSVTAWAAALFLVPAICFAAAADVPRNIDEDGPSLGVQTLDLVEMWRVGGEDESVILGRITDVLGHPNGNIYVLDYQLCQVVAISPDGEHLADLSRQGDGPGELRQPMALALLSEEVLGVGIGFPGKIVTMKLDGTPISSLYPIGEPAEGNIGIMMSSKFFDGFLVSSGGRIVFEDQDNSHTERFLSVAGGELDEFQRILETRTPLDPTGRTFVEEDNYYIDLRWTLGPGGTIYAPMRRDAYEVSEYDRTGKLLQVFGRKYEPRKRSQDEKDDVRPLISVNGQTDSRDWEISDHDECIVRLQYNHDDRTVWVLTPHGANDQPDGILETWDIFSTDGEYLEQVALPLGDEINDGTLYLVGGGRLVVVRGANGPNDGGSEDEDEEELEEVEPLEVICYRINSPLYSHRE